MNDKNTNNPIKKNEVLISKINGGLIVSCQAPVHSPLAKPEIIAAFAACAANNGASAVRIDSPANVRAVNEAVETPIFGIYKIVNQESEVYITPTFEAAREIAAAGADVIAVDATERPRPEGARILDLCEQIHNSLHLPVMADVSKLDEGIRAAEQFGCDFISTTLSGYTNETSHLSNEPDFELIEQLVRRVSVPVIAEGRLKSPFDVKRAFECGAFAVVVGGAITGVDDMVKKFAASCPGIVPDWAIS